MYRRTARTELAEFTQTLSIGLTFIFQSDFFSSDKCICRVSRLVKSVKKSHALFLILFIGSQKFRHFVSKFAPIVSKVGRSNPPLLPLPCSRCYGISLSE